MFVIAAISDSYGFGYEFAPADFVATNNDPHKGYIQHPNRPHVPGTYSDDTQMAVALALALLKVKGNWKELTAHQLATQFVAQFKADPRPGYSQGFYELLTELAKFKGDDMGTEFLKRVKPSSSKSGAAMRAWPCGLLPTPKEAVDLAIFQASLTHATRTGVDSAAAVALMVWCCRQGFDSEMLVNTLEDWVPGYTWEAPWSGPVSSDGIEVVRAALTPMLQLDMVRTCSMTQILQECIAFTGDVDSVACIALAAASQHPLIINDLPKVLYKTLEKGSYGRKFLESLDARMEAVFPCPRQIFSAFCDTEPEDDGSILGLFS